MRMFLAVALAAGPVWATPAIAQNTGTQNSSTHVSLKQLTLRLAGMDQAEQTRRVAEFQAAAKAMTQCDDAEGVAKDLGVEVVVNRDLALSAVPEALRKELATMPVGTATSMFGQRDSEVRVLLLCGRSEQ